MHGHHTTPRTPDIQVNGEEIRHESGDSPLNPGSAALIADEPGEVDLQRMSDFRPQSWHLVSPHHFKIGVRQIQPEE